jgi:hypothetical protein
LDTQAKAPKKIFVSSSRSSGNATVSWFESKEFVLRYNLEVSSDSGINWDPVAQYADVTLAYANLSLTGGTYQFRVNVDAIGLSTSPWTYSSLVSVSLTVDAPRKIFVSKTKNGGAQVSWFESATPDVTFVLEESTDGGNIWTGVPEYTDSALAYADVIGSGEHIFRVMAVKVGYGDSVWNESKSVLL